MSGRRAILLTGRQLDDLLTVCPRLSLFDYVVAENGAVLYEPRTRQQTLLGKLPPARFLRRLQELTDNSIAVGKVIVDTRVPHHTAVLQVIQEMGLELQIVFNRDAVMVLPAGVNKASGLNDALSRLGLSRHNVAGIGDAENDFAFLELCEVSAAWENSIPRLKDSVDLVTKAPRGAGVRELVRRMLKDDLRSVDRDIL